MKRRRLLRLLSAALWFLPAVALADGLPVPTGRVVLTVTGAIANTNAGGEAHFDAAMLDALPRSSKTTSTPWAEGAQHFEGVRLYDVLKAVGAQGRVGDFLAINDYRIAINLREVERYDPLVARSVDGKALSVRDKGPLWLIYPFDQVSDEAEKTRFMSRMIWQLVRIHIR